MTALSPSCHADVKVVRTREVHVGTAGASACRLVHTTMRGASGIIDADVFVVGAGIAALAHAHEARSRGLSVVLLDRDDHAVGASVRNFGHLFFTSVADGAPFERAMLARERWLELIDRAGLHVV